MIKDYFLDIEDFFKSINRGTFGLYCATFTTMRLNKYPNDKEHSQAVNDNEYNKYENRVEVLGLYQNACTGVNFYNCVKSECKREGIDFSDDEFNEAFPVTESYCESVSKEMNNFIMKHKSKEQKYLRLYSGRKPTKCIKIILLDGKLVSEDDYKDIKRYLPKFSENKKQTSIGIKNIITPLNVKLENVMFLVQGEKAWVNKNEFGDLGDLNKMIDYVRKSSKEIKF